MHCNHCNREFKNERGLNIHLRSKSHDQAVQFRRDFNDIPTYPNSQIRGFIPKFTEEQKQLMIRDLAASSKI